MRCLAWVFRVRRRVSAEDLARAWNRSREIEREISNLDEWKAGIRALVREQQTATINQNQEETQR